MKKLCFGVVVILLIGGIFLSQKLSVEVYHPMKEISLTKEEASQREPLVAITEEDYALRDAVLQMEEVQTAIAKGEMVVFSEQEKNEICNFFPEEGTCEEFAVHDGIVMLWFREEKRDWHFDLSEEHIYKIIGERNRNGEVEDIYMNHNNMQFWVWKEGFPKLEFYWKDK